MSSIESSPIDTQLNEIEQLKARIAELENELSNQRKPAKRVYEPCQCPECKRMLKNKFTLKTHINNVHNKDRQRFECPHCGKRLKSKYYLQTHINVIHADELKVLDRNVSIEVNEPSTVPDTQ